MRCPDCQKFVSFDTDVEPDVDLQVDDFGTVSGNCRIVNACADCGTELTSADFDIEVDFTDTVDDHKKAFPDKTHTLSVSGDASRTERSQTEGRNGKPLTGPARYRKHYYGATIDVTLECSCGEALDHDSETWSDDVQASGMDEA